MSKSGSVILLDNDRGVGLRKMKHVSNVAKASHFIFCCAALGRYDYEEVDLDAAIQMMEDLELMILEKAFMGQRFAVGEKLYQVEKADNFEYTDPVDGRICRNQVRNGGGYFGVDTELDLHVTLD